MPSGVYERKGIKERFEHGLKISPNKNCIEWEGSLKRGCGKISINGKIIRASRFAYTLYCGKIPKGLYVCHTCDNSKCVNPKHLFVGTQKDNMRDMINKGRQAKQYGVKNPFYGKHHTDTTKKNISDRLKGKIPWMKGRHHTEKTKQKMREMWKGRKNRQASIDAMRKNAK